MTLSNKTEYDALALEYQTDYGSARGHANVSDVINNPNASGVCRVFGPGFFEKKSDLLFAKLGSITNDVPDSFLVCKDTV